MARAARRRMVIGCFLLQEPAAAGRWHASPAARLKGWDELGTVTVSSGWCIQERCNPFTIPRLSLRLFARIRVHWKCTAFLIADLAHPSLVSPHQSPCESRAS